MDTQDLNDRLARLERQNRRLRGGLFALLALVGLALTGSVVAGGQRLEAQQFRVVDGQGRTRAILGPGSLVLYDDTGKQVASLGEGATMYPVTK
jgi:hypothetical protein